MDAKPTKKEQVAQNLRALYSSYGYCRYRMSNFEEYSFYLKNKNFLTSDKIVTFNDLDGRLMALKPDVTLSIVKTAKPGDKLYYIENVYRPMGISYREIEQMGVETVGKINVHVEAELLLLAAKSLREVDENCVLDISHVGLVNALADKAGADKKDLLALLSKKNYHEAAERYPENEAVLKALFFTDLSAAKTYLTDKEREYVDELLYLIDFLNKAGQKAEADFSLVDDERYYNGIIFRGYVKKVPRPILSGGRYDRLLKKMHKDFGGMGFALYLNEISLYDERPKFDCDCLVLYTETETSYHAACDYADALRAQGKTVRLSPEFCPDLRTEKTVLFDRGGKIC
ncbi:MAG: ATP phosphoribosyltransferase regulatory subunit [Clostridia bacterium]|nr:ATP phosphoribosyltransferase regulatory subunit [Clostridia bacterium]